MFPVKYRWPVFAARRARRATDYHAIIDEEGKVRARTPQVSKFRHMPFDFSDDERGRLYCDHVDADRALARRTTWPPSSAPRSTRGRTIARSGRERVYVGYSPIIVVDADKILADLPQAHVLHVVRNPWSAYADTKKRPVPLVARPNYLLGWTLNQYHALLVPRAVPGAAAHRARRGRDGRPACGTLGPVLRRDSASSGRSRSRTRAGTAQALAEVYPWGTIRTPTPAANRRDGRELSPAERDEIRQRAWQYLESFDYRSIA